MSTSERDRQKALSAISYAISTRPATWSPEGLLYAVVESGAVVWATDHTKAVTELAALRRLVDDLLDANQLPTDLASRARMVRLTGHGGQ